MLQMALQDSKWIKLQDPQTQLQMHAAVEVDRLIVAETRFLKRQKKTLFGEK
jgi:hypothetical protein